MIFPYYGAPLGIKEFKVNNAPEKVDNILWRGSAPTCRADLEMLKAIGVTRIICLQEGWSKFFGGYDPLKEWVAMGGTYYAISWSNFFSPSDDEVRLAHGLVGAGTFVHCKKGVDRTGYFVAKWKVWQGISGPVAAWEEAQRKGMHAWFRWRWKNAFFENELGPG